MRSGARHFMDTLGHISLSLGCLVVSVSLFTLLFGRLINSGELFPVRTAPFHFPLHYDVRASHLVPVCALRDSTQGWGGAATLGHLCGVNYSFGLLILLCYKLDTSC
jgi:hypothetical protein